MSCQEQTSFRIPTWCQERGQPSSQELSTRKIC